MNHTLMTTTEVGTFHTEMGDVTQRWNQHDMNILVTIQQ
jgi:hypothetical protein